MRILSIIFRRPNLVLIVAQIIQKQGRLLNDLPLLAHESAKVLQITRIVFAWQQNTQQVEILFLTLLHGSRAQKQDIFRCTADPMQEPRKMLVGKTAMHFIYDDEIPCRIGIRLL